MMLAMQLESWEMVQSRLCYLVILILCLEKSIVHDDNGILYGRGSVDAKGPLACFTDAVAQVGAVDGWQFVVIGAVEEERNSEGARFVVDQYKPDFAIIGEPNRWDRIALGYKGSAWANVTVKREQMHTASGEETACESAIGLWLKIKAYADSFNQDKPKAFDKLLLTLRGMDSDSNDFEQWARLKSRRAIADGCFSERLVCKVE